MRRKSSSAGIEWLWAAALALGTTAARADAHGDAQRLFDEARALLDANQVPEACEKLEASLALDAANGTRLNLAVCRERQGLIAAAAVLFTEVVRQAKAAGQADREAVAMKHLDALGPRIPTLEVRVPRSARDAGLRLWIDGVDREMVLRGGVLLAEPGAHHLEIVSEDGRRAAVDITLDEGARKIVDLDLPPPEERRMTAPAPPPIVRAPTPVDLPPEVTPIGSAWPVAAGVGVGLGALTTAIGIGFGIRAASLDSDADDACPADLRGRCTTEQGESDAQAAGDAATASNILVGAGLVIAVGSAVALLWAPWETGRPASGRPASGRPASGRRSGIAILPSGRGARIEF